MTGPFRIVEINGGRVSQHEGWRLWLDPSTDGYGDAQIDDYGGRKRSEYRWRPGTRMALKARFSHEADHLVGTAGFGFWNAPFGDPSIKIPALPQAAWFFYASEPSDLPFLEAGPGRGWFAGTVDATTVDALTMAPLALPAILMNNSASLRRRIWPRIRRRLGISFAIVHQPMTEWHEYELQWREDGCRFYVDGTAVLTTTFRPRGPLGFVCWLDNQYMVARPTGRFRWGTRSYPEAQWLEVANLRLIPEVGRF